MAFHPVSQMMNLVHFNENVERLSAVLQTLNCTRELVESAVGDVRRSDLVVNPEVSVWLERAWNTREEIEQVLEFIVSGRRGVKSTFSNLKMRFKLSSKVAIWIQNVDLLLYSRVHEILQISHPPPPLSVRDESFFSDFGVKMLFELQEQQPELADNTASSSKIEERISFDNTIQQPGKKKRSLSDVLHKLVNTDVKSQIQREDYTNIRSTYNQLSSQKAKLLFLLSCHFPEDESISTEMLVRYGRGLLEFEEQETLESTRQEVDLLVDALKRCELLSDGGDGLLKLEDNKRRVGKSIASKERIEMCVVRHSCGLNHSYSNEMHELPVTLAFPVVNLLWLVCSHHDGIEISADIFEGMSKLKGLYVKANVVKPLPLTLPIKSLMMIQTLCLDFCTLTVDISFIGSLKNLEILSFFQSELGALPREIRGLTKLKLLDLRCRMGPTFIPSGTFSRLTKLEELYTGRYFDNDTFTLSSTFPIRNSVEVKDLNNLSQLRVLQISLDLNHRILKMLKDFKFSNLIRFDFSTCTQEYSLFPVYKLANTVGLRQADISVVLDTRVKEIMQLAESLHLRELKKSKNPFIELDRTPFSALRRLSLTYCPDVEFIVGGSKSSAVTNLQSLEIVSLTNLREISYEDLPEDSFSSLEELTLYQLPVMERLWKKVVAPSLGNLRILKMEFCGAIRSLFPSSLVRCLPKLQLISVTNCVNLKKVISTEADEDIMAIFIFPELEEVVLSNLTAFRGFFPKSTTKQSLFNQQVVHKVRILKVSGCDSLGAIFDFTSDNHHRGEHGKVMDQLESVELHNLPNLICIWRKLPETSQDFHNLKTLNITDCGKIEYLFPSTDSKLLANLQELLIARCGIMEQVIEIESKDSTDDSAQKREFPKLHTLQLEDMKKLKIFWYGEHDLELMNLEKVTIINCPEMVKFFYPGNLVTPKVERVHTKLRNSNQWVWKNDLNRTVEYLRESAKDAE
jgi:disease resistance protein RPS2